MASELYVETLKGLTSGANANKVIIPSGQTLDASAGTFTPSSGQIIQVVNRYSDGYQEIASTTFTDANSMSLAITPTSSSSSIFILINLSTTLIRASNSRIGGKAKVLRDSTTVIESSNFQRIGAGTDAIGENYLTVSGCLTALDSPATTSEITYKLQLAAEVTGNSGRIRINDSSPRTRLSNITLMEIAG